MREETLHHFHFAGARHARQAVQEQAPVALGHQARVAHHQQTVVVGVADQPAGALAQGQHRLGQLVVAEGVAAVGVDVLDARRRHRVPGGAERQLVDDHATERLATHVDALPETAGAKQHRITQTPELVQQFPTAGLALHQQRVFQLLLAQQRRRLAQGPVAGEQKESAALGGADHRNHRPSEACGVVRRGRRRQVLGHVEHRLAFEIERALQAQGLRLVQAQALLQVLEAPRHRQGRRGQDPGAGVLFALGAQLAGHRQRRAVQHHGAAEGLEPVDPVGAVGVEDRFERQHVLGGAPGAGLQAPAGAGLGLEKIVQVDERVEQRLAGLAHRRQLRHLGPGGAAFLLAQAQAQVLAGLVQGGDVLVQRRQIQRRVGRLGQGVTAQFLDLAGAQGVAEKGGGHLRQLVGLVEDHRVGAGQQLGDALPAQRRVGEEQVVVDHHQIRLLGFLAGVHQRAFAVFGAFGAQAVVGGAGHPGPHRRVLRQLLELGDVAALGAPGPVRHHLQLLGGFPGQETGFLLVQLQPVGAQVVGAALEQRRLARQAQSLEHHRQVLEEKLVLQALGAGGHQRGAIGQQRRQQVGQGLAGAGLGFHQQGAPGTDRLGHRVGHAQLGLAGAIAVQQATEAVDVVKIVAGAVH